MRRLAPWLLAIGFSAPGSAESAGSAEIDAALSCEAAPAPGRVRCDLTVRARAGTLLDWADALVVAAPSFARPLRSRVAPRERRSGVPSVDLPFALVAAGTGRGELRVRARAVVCRAALCRPASRDVRTELAVGQTP